MFDVDLPGYDLWKLAAPNQDAPIPDARCEKCGFEDYKENMVDDLCEDCDRHKDEEEEE